MRASRAKRINNSCVLSPENQRESARRGRHHQVAVPTESSTAKSPSVRNRHLLLVSRGFSNTLSLLLLSAQQAGVVNLPQSTHTLNILGHKVWGTESPHSCLEECPRENWNWATKAMAHCTLFLQTSRAPGTRVLCTEILPACLLDRRVARDFRSEVHCTRIDALGATRYG